MNVLTDDQATLLELIERQQAQIEEQQALITRLEARIQELEARLGGGTPHQRMPGHKPTPPPRTDPPRPRKRRAQNYGRVRGVPTRQVVHALDHCPDCGGTLVGGSVKRTREVIELTLPPVEIVEHQYLERICPLCRKHRTPKVDLTEEVVGQGRLGVQLTSLIVTLREVGRWPFQTIQWYLATVHQFHLSVGAIVRAGTQVAQAGESAVQAILQQLRDSPVVHADETGWRENGQNRYVWSFSTPTARYFTFGTRAGTMVDEVLGEDFGGVLVSDGYAGYNHYPCPHQRCWVHLLRDLHELKQRYPTDAKLARWTGRIHALYLAAKAYPGEDLVPTERERVQAKRQFQQRLHRLVEPYLKEAVHPRHQVSGYIERFLHDWFTFVVYPEAPSDNNAAERSVRHLVVTRKISGGTRSAAGTQAKMALATLFGTWTARGLNPFTSCRLLLTSPQL
jgi:transposase